MTAALAVSAATSPWCALRLLVRRYRPDDLSRLDQLGWHEDDLDALSNELWGAVVDPDADTPPVPPVTLADVLTFSDARLWLDWRDVEIDRLAELHGPYLFGVYCGPERIPKRSRAS